MLYFISRNAYGRPTLMHAAGLPLTVTLCGIDASHWSRKYFSFPIEVMLCQKCKKVVSKK